MPTADRAVWLSLPSSSKTEVALMTHSFAKVAASAAAVTRKETSKLRGPGCFAGKSYYTQVLQWAPATDEKWVYR